MTKRNAGGWGSSTRARPGWVEALGHSRRADSSSLRRLRGCWTLANAAATSPSGETAALDTRAPSLERRRAGAVLASRTAEGAGCSAATANFAAEAAGIGAARRVVVFRTAGQSVAVAGSVRHGCSWAEGSRTRRLQGAVVGIDSGCRKGELGDAAARGSRPGAGAGNTAERVA